MAVAGQISHWIPEPGERPELRDLTVSQLLEESAARWPDREAVVYSAYDDLGISERWTFAELRERSREAGRAFVAHGFERGERVGIWATNRPEWLLVQLGAAYAGVVIVPMNPLYRSSEVSYVLGRAGASACFVEPSNRGVSLWDILEEAAAELPDLHTRIGLGDSPLPLEEWLSRRAPCRTRTSTAGPPRCARPIPHRSSSPPAPRASRRAPS
jgi:fatty-acyl-CoA synthase